MILSESDFTALAITLKMASLTTLILLLLGTPLAGGWCAPGGVSSFYWKR